MALESTNTLKSNGRKINTTYGFLTIQLSQNYHNASKTELLVLIMNLHLHSMSMAF